MRNVILWPQLATVYLQGIVHTLIRYHNQLVIRRTSLSMPTKPEIVSPEERIRRKENALSILESYKDRTMGLIMRIRYDPWPSEEMLNASVFQKYSEQGFFLAKMHYELLMFSQRVLQWRVLITFETFLSILQRPLLEQALSEATLFTITLYNDGTLNVDTEPCNERRYNLIEGLVSSLAGIRLDPANCVDLVIDTSFTLPGPHTSFRTTNQESAKRARHRTAPYEPILWNTQNQVIGTVAAALAVRRDGVWVTPHVQSGVVCDALRSVMLETGAIAERILLLHELKKNEEVLIISSEYGVMRGRIISEPPLPPKPKRKRRSQKGSMKRVPIPRSKEARLAAERNAQLTSQMAAEAHSFSNSGIPGTTVLRFKPSSFPAVDPKDESAQIKEW